MLHYTAEDFRNLVNTLEEYIQAVGEDESLPSDNSQPVNTMLTRPAGLQKVAGSLDVNKLISLLNIPANLQSDFKTAITTLQDDNPQLSPGQSLALATAFDHMLALNLTGKGEAMTDIKTVGSPGVSESSEDVKNKSLNINTLEQSIKDASNCSPVAKLQSTKLVKHLTDGMAGRTTSGGIDNIITGIISAISAAKSGKESDALKYIASMVNHTEGDEHAINGDVFPNIVVSLMLLVGDILQHSEE